MFKGILKKVYIQNFGVFFIKCNRVHLICVRDNHVIVPAIVCSCDRVKPNDNIFTVIKLQKNIVFTFKEKNMIQMAFRTFISETTFSVKKCSCYSKDLSL